ncbi:MAG TPA: hypothetical protein VMN03_17260 [Burkholderiales bacterium]|nr:hypothetical protein [Burkholderiales bacterium]
MERMEVVSPLGLDTVKRIGAAPRVGPLDGKTIGEIWNGVFKGDVTFPVIRRLLKQRYPGLRIIPYTEFPHAPGSDHPAEQREHARRVAALAREKGCDAVISGNGA